MSLIGIKASRVLFQSCCNLIGPGFKTSAARERDQNSANVGQPERPNDLLSSPTGKGGGKLRDKRRPRTDLEYGAEADKRS